MNSLDVNETVDSSSEALIDWGTPEIVINTTHGGDYYNNPFDAMELKAANMDPFDLVSNQTTFREDNNMSCSNLLTNSWKLEIGQIRKSMSLTDINSATANLQLNGQNHTGNIESLSVNGSEIITNCSALNKDENLIENQCYVPINMDDSEEFKNDSISTSSSEYYNIYIEKMALCNEEEKQKIREETQQRIKMLIEKGEKNYEENCTQKSLFYMLRNRTESSLNSTENEFNEGFIQNGSNSNTDTFSKITNNTTDINDNNSMNNVSLLYLNQEQNSFDLNALKPEWVMDNFSDTDGSIDVQTEKSESVVEPIYSNNQIDEKLKTLNRIGIMESKVIGCQALKSIPDKKNLGPILANVPVHHMVQNYNDVKIKNMCSSTSISSHNQIKPVASSTPTLNVTNTFQIPTSEECSITACSQQLVVNTVGSPKTSLNVTKCIKQNSTTLCNNDNIITPSNGTRVFSTANKRSNTTIDMFNESIKKKNEIIKSFQSNKSKSESIIGKIPKPLALKTNRMSSLPIPKRSTISFKGKENVKLK